MPLELYPYQGVGAAHLAARYRAGLFDEPGVGKSSQAIRAADIRGAIRGMVIGPAGLRANWIREFTKFSTVYRRMIKGETIHDYVAWERGRFDVIVTSYEQATKWASAIHKDAEFIDFIIVDEAHMLRNHETSRAKAILGPNADGRGGILQWSFFAWWLTGTPVWNDPLDIWSFLRFTGDTDMSLVQFRKAYFDTRPTTYSLRCMPKEKTVGELRSMIGRNSLTRKLADTGVELPPIFLTDVLVEGDTQAIRQLLMDYPGLDDAIIQALREDRGLSSLDADHLMTLRRLLGEAKAIPYAAMLLHELNSGVDKVVVFGIHRQALTLVRDYLWRHGIDGAVMNGATSPKEDEANMLRFAADPTMRFFAVNIRKGGAGLNMVAASHIDMLESDWTPMSNFQALKRVHRIGQTRTVRARFITLADSFDEIVNQIVAEKAAAIAKIEGVERLPLQPE